jgi:hypothetical protein
MFLTVVGGPISSKPVYRERSTNPEALVPVARHPTPGGLHPAESPDARPELILAGLGWGQDMPFGLFQGQGQRPFETDPSPIDVLILEEIHDDALDSARW